MSFAIITVFLLTFVLFITDGSHTIVLKLTNYLNDTVTVNVLEGKQITSDRTMVSDQSITVVIF